MKLLWTVAFSLILLACAAQETQYAFKATSFKVNNKGQKISSSTATPSIIRVNTEAGTISIETQSPEIRELLNNDMEFSINKQMGKIGTQYSYQVDDFVLVHFYMDRRMIIFTRNDAHPLDWGIQFLETERAN